MDVADPIGNGWFLNEGKIDIEWMTCNPAPDEVYLLFITTIPYFSIKYNSRFDNQNVSFIYSFEKILKNDLRCAGSFNVK